MDDDVTFQCDPAYPDAEFQLEPNLQDMSCGSSPISPETSPCESAAGRCAVRPRKPDRQNGKTKQIVEARLSRFDPETSRARKVLRQLYGPAHNHDLLSLAKLCCQYLDIYLDREAQRLKPVLLKWFDENIEQIEPFLRKHVVVTCEDGRLAPTELIQQVPSIAEQIKAAEAY
jgi:hypothetical protein